VPEAQAQFLANVPPIPAVGPLSRPKSLNQVGAPLDATRATAPADNPQTREKVALGEKLFFEGGLSVDGTVACSTCHDPARTPFCPFHRSALFLPAAALVKKETSRKRQKRWHEKALASAVIQRWPGGMSNGKERDFG
jgi:cytochrome c peroxidase